jgi:hypothetical protein
MITWQSVRLRIAVLTFLRVVIKYMDRVNTSHAIFVISREMELRFHSAA